MMVTSAFLSSILNQITIYKDDECVLANNSHRAKWKVISPTGNEAMVPSVCFTVPPPNKEAVDFANRFVWFGAFLKVKEAIRTVSGTYGVGKFRSYYTGAF